MNKQQLTFNGRVTCRFSLLLVLLLSVWPKEVMAQLEEIIVTAERRQATLQDVPISVTAFTGDMIESLQIDNYSDLVALTPGFSLSAFTKTWMNPTLRGGSTSLVSAGAEQAVGLYIDDVYYGGSGDFMVDLFDVERIEVLRGPQGTLFGRNTTGGAINVITKDPNMDVVEGKIAVSGGNYELVQIRGMLTGPLADNLGGMVSFISTTRHGTSFNSVTGKDVDNISRAALRGKLLWEPSADLQVTLGVAYSTADETGVARDIVANDPLVPVTHEPLLGFVPDRDPRTVQMNDDGRYSNDQYAANLHIEKDFNPGNWMNGQLVSITTARNFDSDETPQSITGTPSPIYNVATPKDNETYSQEFRFISDYDGPLNWVGGVFFYYSDETRNVETDFHWATTNSGGFLQALAGCPVQDPADSAMFSISPACVENFPQLFALSHYAFVENVRTTSVAAYAQGTYDIGDHLAITLGGRYTYDEKKLKGRTSGDFDFVWNPLPGATLRDTDSWDEATWRAAVQWNPVDRIMLYGSASTGFRSGAYAIGQGNPSLLDKPVAPETVLGFEVGLKSWWFDDRVQLNVAAYDATYEDLQFFVQSAGTLGVAQTTNAGEATSQGIELEFLWAITPELTYGLNYSHQTGDSKGIPADVQEDVPLGTPPAGTIPNAYTMMLDYLKPWGNGEFSFHFDFTHKDEYTLEFVDNSVPGLRTETVADVAMSMGYEFKNGWSVQAWVKNLLDEDIVLYGQDFWFGVYDVFTAFVTNPEVQNSSWGPRYSEPRTYGVTVQYQF